MTALQTPMSLESTIGHIAGVIGSEGFPTGERAALRRINPGQTPPLAFYRFALRHLGEGWESSLADWMTLVAGIALMSPNAHRPDRGLGRALAESGYAEARLERLLASEGNTRRTLILRTARFLAAKGSPCNWAEVAQLLLTREPEKRERLHRRIARDFYRYAEKE